LLKVPGANVMSIDFNNKFTICVYHLNTDCPFYNMPPILPIYIVL